MSEAENLPMVADQVTESPPEQPEQPAQTQSMMALIEKAVSDPTIDVDKMQQLFEMQERWMIRQGEIDFNVAFNEMQPNLPIIKKDSKIVHQGKNGDPDKVISTYAKYEAIDEAISKIYHKHGFSTSFNTRAIDKATVYSIKLMHIGGHSTVTELVLPVDTSGAKNPVQGVGSTTKYAQRYLITMALNLVFEDDPNDDDARGFGLIDTERAATIDTLIRESYTDREKFLNAFDIDDVQKLKSKDFDGAVKMLERKKKLKKEADAKEAAGD